MVPLTESLTGNKPNNALVITSTLSSQPPKEELPKDTSETVDQLNNTSMLPLDKMVSSPLLSLRTLWLDHNQLLSLKPQLKLNSELCSTTATKTTTELLTLPRLPNASSNSHTTLFKPCTKTGNKLPETIMRLNQLSLLLGEKDLLPTMSRLSTETKDQPLPVHQPPPV